MKTASIATVRPGDRAESWRIGGKRPLPTCFLQSLSQRLIENLAGCPTLLFASDERIEFRTFIGRIERGFTFLGYWITEKGVTGVAPSTWEAFQERVARLYEQDAPPEEIRRRIEQCVRRWMRWVVSGVRDVSVAFVGRDECPVRPVFVPRMLIPAAQ